MGYNAQTEGQTPRPWPDSFCDRELGVLSISVSVITEQNTGACNQNFWRTFSFCILITRRKEKKGSLFFSQWVTSVDQMNFLP